MARPKKIESVPGSEMWRAEEEMLRAEMRPPDLQALVMLAGGWDKITAEQWARYDRERLHWQHRLAIGMFRDPPYRDLEAGT